MARSIMYTEYFAISFVIIMYSVLWPKRMYMTAVRGVRTETAAMKVNIAYEEELPSICCGLFSNIFVRFSGA